MFQELKLEFQTHVRVEWYETSDKYIAYKMEENSSTSEHVLRMSGSNTKKDTSVTFWVERFFFCHAYDTSIPIIMTKPGIIIGVVGSYFYDKKS